MARIRKRAREFQMDLLYEHRDKWGQGAMLTMEIAIDGNNSIHHWRMFTERQERKYIIKELQAAIEILEESNIPLDPKKGEE